MTAHSKVETLPKNLLGGRRHSLCKLRALPLPLVLTSDPRFTIPAVRFGQVTSSSMKRNKNGVHLSSWGRNELIMHESASKVRGVYGEHSASCLFSALVWGSSQITIKIDYEALGVHWHLSKPYLKIVVYVCSLPSGRAPRGFSVQLCLLVKHFKFVTF